MLIRKEQLLEFKKYAVRDFVSRMEKHLRNAFPAQTQDMDSSGLRSRVEAAVAVAERLGLARECDVEGYLNVMCASSADLGTDPPPWILQILDDDAIGEESKIELLYSAYRERHHGR